MDKKVSGSVTNSQNLKVEKLRRHEESVQAAWSQRVGTHNLPTSVPLFHSKAAVAEADGDIEESHRPRGANQREFIKLLSERSDQ